MRLEVGLRLGSELGLLLGLGLGLGSSIHRDRICQNSRYRDNINRTTNFWKISMIRIT